MEAPKKIYLTKNLLGELRDGWDAQPSEVFTNIEYTRTDAFIKKACDYWYKYNQKLDMKGFYGLTVNVHDFMDYMKGE